VRSRIDRIAQKKETYDLLLELVTHGFITNVGTKTYDFINEGILDVEKYDLDSKMGFFSPIEYLVHQELTNFFLRTENRIRYIDSLLHKYEDPANMKILQVAKFCEGGKFANYKGRVFELVFAAVLIQVAEDLNGQPLIKHPLFYNMPSREVVSKYFSEINKEILENYTLEVNQFLFVSEKEPISGSQWLTVMKEKDTSKVCFFQQQVGPENRRRKKSF
jgi:hypothetical protein